MLTSEEQALVARPWIYKYAAIDVWVSTQTEGARVSQLEKVGPIGRQLRDAILRNPSARVLACSTDDGYYGLFALFKGAAHVDIRDVGAHIPEHEGWHFEQSRVVAKLKRLLGRCSFGAANLFDLDGSYDIGSCTNVLEHMSDPQVALEKLRTLVRGSLVVHSPTVHPNKSGMLEISPEGRPWGSRFSHDDLVEMAVAAGWTVINERLKQMPEDWGLERRLSFLHLV